MLFHMQLKKLIPLIVVPVFAIISGVLIIPELEEQKDRPEIESIPTLEKGMAQAMESDCGSTNKLLCEKLDKIIENQEKILQQQNITQDFINDVYDELS